MDKQRVILYFGSFNPVHLGHMAVAEYVLRTGMFDKLWFVVSPQNPLKQPGMLADGAARVDMVRLAVEASALSGKMSVCTVEFELPVPSYTIDTMNELERRFPEVEYSILMGSDSAATIESWRNWRELLARYAFYVYPRSGSRADGRFKVLHGAPEFDCSSTDIRRMVAAGEDVSALVCQGVVEYIKRNGLWR